MQIVIELPDDKWKSYQPYKGLPYDNIMDNSVRYIANGIPLPKGHGDLIDRSKIYKAIYAEDDNCTGLGMSYEEMDAYNEGIDIMYSLVQGVKPLIKADGGEAE